MSQIDLFYTNGCVLVFLVKILSEYDDFVAEGALALSLIRIFDIHLADKENIGILRDHEVVAEELKGARARLHSVLALRTAL